MSGASRLTGRRHAWLPIVVIAALGLASCGRKSDGTRSDSAAGEAADSASAATPVTMGRVMLRTLEVTVTGPGVVDVAEDARVRAPFDGVLTDLTPRIGDAVRAGEVIGRMVAANSEAALRGARDLVASARTPAEEETARRALQVAEAGLVHAPIVAPRGGIVIAQPAAAGERLTQGDSIISIAVTGRMVFFTDVAQQDLARVQAGDPARVSLAAREGWLAGVVNRILPSDTGRMADMQVRVDLRPNTFIRVGLFGTATIVVAQHVNVPTVPRAALVRDDITGVTRIALVDAHGVAHWVEVTPGVVDSAWAEIVQPRLPVGQRVITGGAVGLPDSTRVVAVPDTTVAGRATASGGTGVGTGAGTVGPATGGAGNGGAAKQSGPPGSAPPAGATRAP